MYDRVNAFEIPNFLGAEDIPLENMELVKDETIPTPFGKRAEKCWNINDD